MKTYRKTLLNNTDPYCTGEYGAELYQCRYCRQVFTRSAITADHIIPRSKGGTNDPDNLAAACAPCNEAKGDVYPVLWIKLKEALKI